MATVPWHTALGLTGTGQQPIGLQAPPPGGFQYQDPMQGMGFLNRMQYLAQNNPEVLTSIGAGMMRGDLASGFENAAAASGDFRKEKMAEQYQNVVGNQTKAWLLDQGYSEADANAAMMNPEILNSLLKRRDYELQQQMQQKYADPATMASVYGTLVHVKGPGGEYGVAQPAKDGSGLIMNGQPLPPGWQPLNPYEIATTRAAGTAVGTGAGEAFSAIPGAQKMHDQISGTLDQLIRDPYLPSMVGPIEGRLPNVGADAERVQSLMNQLQGGAFLEGRQLLKGQGAITEKESDKAEDAFSRLQNPRLSYTDYIKAATDFKEAIDDGLAKIQAQAAQMGTGGISGVPTGGGAPRKKYNAATGRVE